MQKKGYNLFNIPKEYSQEAYKEAVKSIIQKYSKIDSLISIFSWGDASVPGISDVDILLVFRKNANKLSFLNRSFYFLDFDSRYLVRHPFVFIGEDSFKNLRYIYPNTNVKFLFGKKANIRKLSPNESYYSSISLLNDIIIRHYPRDFIEQFVNKRINVRDTLLRLNSLKYTVKFLEKLTREKNAEWDSKLSSIDKLRKNWFKEKNFELLILLSENSVDTTMEIIEKFRNFLTKNNLVKIISDRMQYNGIKNKSIFIKDWKKEKALNDMIDSIKNKQFYSILPIELAAQLSEYSKYNGFISQYIKNNITNNIDYQIRYKNIIKHRIEILNKQAKLASKLKHSDFAAFFDFGYRNKTGINNWIFNLIDKIRF